MNSLDAAYRVLAEAGHPLNYREITRRMLSAGLWHTVGKTPENTVNRDISQEITRLGKRSRFVRITAGIYGLMPAAAADAKAVQRTDSGPLPSCLPDAKRPSAPQGTRTSGGLSDLALVVAAWPDLPSTRKREIIEIVRRSQETGRSRDPVVAQVLPNGPRTFPAGFVAAGVATGASVELPDEPVEVAWQPDGTNVVRSHFGFVHQVRNATEGRFVFYAHLRGHRAVPVPEKMIHVFKAVKAYEQYLRGLWQDLFRAYGRVSGDRAQARRQANQVFMSLGLPLDSAEAIKESEVVDAKPQSVKRRRRGQRTSETQFYVPILHALAQMGGSGKMADVIKRVGQMMNGKLKSIDLEPLSSTGMPRWDTSVRFARLAMVRNGLLKDGSRHGVWEMTDKGRGLIDHQ